ncbi:unnamed protein product [marine sediment metagenome]|uniref:NTP pyrophosphohydrolase MazG putative catalytic core domain-containing protein n=1 Tax=marine sediment metagenome TaxID=412755 RepID=X1R0E9_9ZZZZ
MNPILKDDNTTISFFKEEVREFVRERNWAKFHTPKNLIQALSIEVAELSEIFLFKDYSLDTISKNKEILERLSDEIADVFIYLISLTNSVNVDLTDIFFKKMEKNRNKYSPEEFNNGSYRKL